MKTSDEIKKGLECCIACPPKCLECPYSNTCDLPFGDMPEKDALAYIRLLESTYSQVSKALCGKENAVLDELLQVVDQLKKIQAEAIAIKLELDAVKRNLAQVERERDAAVRDIHTVLHNRGIDADCVM